MVLGVSELGSMAAGEVSRGRCAGGLSTFRRVGSFRRSGFQSWPMQSPSPRHGGMLRPV